MTDQQTPELPPENPPPPEPAGMTPEQLAEAKRYGRVELICGLADKALDLVFLSVAARGGPALTLAQHVPWLQHPSSLRLLALFLLVTGGHLCVSFPLSFYSGYVVENRFALSTLSFGGWLWRYAKRNGLAAALGAALVLGLFWLIWTTHGWWWLAAAAAFFAVSVVFGQLLPVLILPLFYKIEKLDAPELAERIGRLAAGTGLSIEGVYRMALSDETVKANAMLAGLGRTRRVLLGDTLLAGFTPGGDRSDLRPRDRPPRLSAHPQDDPGRPGPERGRLLDLRPYAGQLWPATALALDYAALPVWTLPWIMLILTAFFLLVEPLENWISRRRERQCDRYALERTGLKAAYLRAFRKLARINKDDPEPHPLEVILFHSHPPIAERLAMAEEI